MRLSAYTAHPSISMQQSVVTQRGVDSGPAVAGWQPNCIAPEGPIIAAALLAVAAMFVLLDQMEGQSKEQQAAQREQEAATGGNSEVLRGGSPALRSDLLPDVF
jgi:hypothetical protein